jgi:hypothetical protein
MTEFKDIAKRLWSSKEFTDEEKKDAKVFIEEWTPWLIATALMEARLKSDNRDFIAYPPDILMTFPEFVQREVVDAYREGFTDGYSECITDFKENDGNIRRLTHFYENALWNWRFDVPLTIDSNPPRFARLRSVK